MTNKLTYAVIVSMPPELLTPGILANRFYKPAVMLFRDRREIARLEIDGITEAQKPQAVAMLYDHAIELAWRYLGAIGPIGYEEAEQMVAGQHATVQVEILPVDNYVVPRPTGLQPPDASVLCPKCKKPMIKRKAKNRDDYFYGCKDYPECKGIRSINT